MKITNPSKGAEFFRKRMSKEVEEVWAAALDPGKQVIAAQCLFRGTVDQCLIHPRDIFRFACIHNASALLVAHNHPSGDFPHIRGDEPANQQEILAATKFSPHTWG